MQLEVLISVDNEEPRLAKGSCSRTLLESIGYDPVYFRERGHLITRWQWVKSHDGYKGEAMPIPSKERKKSPKISVALDRKMAAWFKE